MSLVPSDTQVADMSIGQNDPLGILDPQGARLRIDQRNDFLGVVNEQPISFANMNPGRINSDRLNAKMVGAVALTSNGQELRDEGRNQALKLLG